MQSMGGYLLSDDVQMSLLLLLGYDAKSEVDAFVDLQRGWIIINEEVLDSAQRHWMTCGDVKLPRKRRHEIARSGHHGQELVVFDHPFVASFASIGFHPRSYKMSHG